MFRKIKAKNFFSWKELNFNFEPGITLIAGQNFDDNTSEGVGKSSIPNSLCWVLYGRLPKDVNIEDVIQTGEKSCKVEVELDSGIIISRSRKPNELIINKAGQIIQGKDAKETQKLINDLVGMSFETFCQSVYFGQNYNNKFITANQEDKAKILSELQDLSVFDKAHKQAGDRLKDLKNVESISLVTEKTHKEQTLKLLIEQFETFSKLSETFDGDKLAKLQLIVEKNHKIHEEYDQIQKDLNNITNLDSIPIKKRDIEETNGLLSNIRQKLYYIRALKAAKEQALNLKNCPTCGQTLANNHENIVIEDDAELKEQEILLSEELVVLNNEYNELLQKQNMNQILQLKLNHLKEEREQINKKIIELENMINPYIENMDKTSLKIKQTTNELNILNSKISQVTKEINYLQFLKEGFKEIKSYVFQALLTDLNIKTNKYLKELFEVSAFITFNNISEEGEISKIETIVLLDGHERSLGLLSGGQFRRVQLAVDFALSEIVAERSKLPINLRILDESFKDLSEMSMSRIVSLLQKMKGCTILIEHNSIIKSIVNKVFNIKFENGVSSQIL